MYNVTVFGMHFAINPIAFTIPIGEGWSVYWYGIIIAAGFLGALIYALKVAARYDINVDRLLDVVLVTTPVAILCARAYYVIFDGEKLNGISDFFGLDGTSGFSGLAIYGGVIGAFVCGLLMCKLRKVNVLDVFDLAATGFLFGQGVGRWGNFFNQEAYGTFTGSDWWGMTSERTVREMGEGLVHPCFLYESIWCIAGFFLLNYISEKRQFKGQLVLTYGVWYGFERGFLELIRTDSLMLGRFRVSSLLSFLICIVCTVLLVVIFKKQNRVKKENEYVSVFADNLEPEETTDGMETSLVDDEKIEEETDNGENN